MEEKLSRTVTHIQTQSTAPDKSGKYLSSFTYLKHDALKTVLHVICYWQIQSTN